MENKTEPIVNGKPLSSLQLPATPSWTEAEENRIKELMEEKKCTRIDAVKLMKAERAIREHRPKQAAKANRGEGKAKPVAKAKAAPKEKQAPLVTRYRASAKEPTKALKEKDTQAAKIYRLVRDAKAPGLTYEEIVKGLDRKGLNNDPETVNNCLRWYLSHLKTAGFLLSSSEREKAPKDLMKGLKDKASAPKQEHQENNNRVAAA